MIERFCRFRHKSSSEKDKNLWLSWLANGVWSWLAWSLVFSFFLTGLRQSCVCISAAQTLEVYSFVRHNVIRWLCRGLFVSESTCVLVVWVIECLSECTVSNIDWLSVYHLGNCQLHHVSNLHYYLSHLQKLWAKHRWSFFGLFAQSIICDFVIGWSCVGDFGKSSFSKRFSAQNCLSAPCVKCSFFPFFSSSDHAVFGVHRTVLCVFCCRVPALQCLQYICHRGAAWFQQTGIAYVAAWHLVQLQLGSPDPCIKWTLPTVRCSVCVCPRL